jgi:hypothetical protein
MPVPTPYFVTVSEIVRQRQVKWIARVIDGPRDKLTQVIATQIESALRSRSMPVAAIEG